MPDESVNPILIVVYDGLMTVLASGLGLACLILGWFKLPQYYLPIGAALIVIGVGHNYISKIEMLGVKIDFRRMQQTVLGLLGQMKSSEARELDLYHTESHPCLITIPPERIPTEKERGVIAQEKRITKIDDLYDRVEKAKNMKELNTYLSELQDLVPRSPF